MARRVVFTDHAWSDYLRWQEIDRRVLDRVNDLIEAATRDPFAGIGKPEPLRGDRKGCWARRIDDCHRLVYAVHPGDLVVLQCRYHYGDR
jgi:toxin YoeB